MTIVELQRRIEEEEAAAASVTKRENNWVDAEIRLLIDLWGDDQVQSDLESSCRNIVVYRRIADRLNRAMGETDHQDRTALFLLCNAGQSMNSTRSMVYVTTVRGACAARALIYFLLKTVRLLCTCEPDHIQTRSVLVITL